jgi:hypothetical protein
MPTPSAPPPEPAVPSADGATLGDPVLLRRARIAHLVELGNRIGYGLFAVAVVAFVVGAAAGFSTPDTIVVVGALALGSIVLAPAIVFGYGVKAAEREDRERAAGPSTPRRRH